MLIRTIVLLSSLGMLLSASLLAGEVRRCDAKYEWQTTGGAIGPIPFGEFTAKGNCGSKSVANRCRKRAKAAAFQCINTQWEKRWRHHPRKPDGTANSAYDPQPPEACLEAADIEDYDLTTRCKKRRDNHDSNAICHGHTGAAPVDRPIVAAQGDIKSALETRVCCLYREGKYQFQNEEAVHVRLSARTSSGSGNKHCRSNEVLSSDYAINCKKVREQYCR